MSLSAEQRSAIEDVLYAITNVTGTKPKRNLSLMFKELVDRKDWPDYYQTIPEPRCLDGIHSSLQKKEYKTPAEAYDDISLIFWNALFYNEPESLVVKDAQTLKSIFEAEWKKRPALGPPRTSPPERSPQRVHGVVEEPIEPIVDVGMQSAESEAPFEPKIPSTPQSIRSSARVQANRTPSSRAVAQPVASTSKLSPPKLGTTTRQATPEIDIENDSGAESDSGGYHAGGSSEYSEEIVKQLERSLPRWPGFGEEGWMDDVSPERITEIVHGIKSYKDVVGNRLAVSLEGIPEDSTAVADLSYSHPLSLKMIESRARAQTFTSTKAFDMEMSRLFEKARRYYEPARENYINILLLQRLYNSLTSSTPPPGPPYTSHTNFASFRAGPGASNLTSDGITLTRVTAKDRNFVESLDYKGWTLRLADWVHLSNPDDPGRPIIGQIFRCWVGTAVDTGAPKKDQRGITVVWYYRPEQTFHTADRLFWENEVFKTSNFADHPLTDLIEKVSCQFTARHIRGRPRPPYYHPGFPLYVCDSRYNDRDRIFVKIKNWRSCVPEEVRGKATARTEETRITGDSGDWMPIFPFERTVYPRKMRSPFITSARVVKGPGGVVEGSLKDAGTVTENGGKVTRKAGKRTGAVGGPGYWDPTSEGGGGGVGEPMAASATTAVVPVATTGGYSTTTASAQAYTPPLINSSNLKAAKDRSVLSAAGGYTYAASVDKLPPELTRYFDRDPDTGEVLWFAAPPVNVPRPPALQHSIEYLHFVAMKRKLEGSDRATSEKVTTPVSEPDIVEAGSKRKVPPPQETLQERKTKLWKEMGMDKYVDLSALQ
ncbi:hypothetical protein BDV98DRAFT_530258 [Pterulicium gracile]|uniref:Bromo domain-containing protein n=1 Tax=Pterulicium gracile TaxID=1884261 RepID=A0A5C3QJY4_9AGAR|nr:hypothetical protein BDV98DRAFT_530258 [Pterula gracilis]